VVDAAFVLEGNGLADVGEFSVFKEEKVVFVGDLAELLAKVGSVVFEDVDMGFEHEDMGAKVVCHF